MEGSSHKLNLVGRTSRNEDEKKTGIQVLSEELKTGSLLEETP
jgi:hypothetical protein